MAREQRRERVLRKAQETREAAARGNDRADRKQIREEEKSNRGRQDVEGTYDRQNKHAKREEAKDRMKVDSPCFHSMAFQLLVAKASGKGYHEDCLHGSECMFSHDIRAFTKKQLEDKLNACKNRYWSSEGPKGALMKAFSSLK